MLGEKYKHMQYIGAGVVAVGITIVLAPRLGGDKGGAGTAGARQTRRQGVTAKLAKQTGGFGPNG